MPISRHKGETMNQCVARAMRENTKKHPFKQAVAISMEQCGAKMKRKDALFYFEVIYSDKIKEEGYEGEKCPGKYVDDNK